jgi:hypothetical protein
LSSSSVKAVPFSRVFFPELECYRERIEVDPFPTGDFVAMTMTSDCHEHRSRAGITYNPGATPPSTDKVAVTVVDGFGATDTVNFIFRLESFTACDAVGHARLDVIFATGNNDTLTGGGGVDQFVFDQTTGAHTITDFSTVEDHIDLTALSSIVTAATLNTWFSSNVRASTTNPSDTLN